MEVERRPGVDRGADEQKRIAVGGSSEDDPFVPNLDRCVHSFEWSKRSCG
jgi:hypothetical protein